MLRIDYQRQQTIEETFSKKEIIKKAVADLVSTPVINKKLYEGYILLTDWVNDENHWETKKERLSHLNDLDLLELTQQVVALLALECQKPMKLVSVASMAAKFLGMAHKVTAIQTMAEIIAVLADLDLYDTLQNQDNERLVLSRIQLDDSVIRFAFNAFYLPPMIIKPRTLRHNRDSGYITQRGESLILGFYENHHDEDICLDVLNKLNANEFELDTDFISAQTEKWHKEQLNPEEYADLSHEDKLIYEMDEANWRNFQEQGYKIQTLLLYRGNSFYFQNKVDKRGRIYTSGYHVSPQGSSFKKAMLNLKKKEICTGLEDW